MTLQACGPFWTPDPPRMASSGVAFAGLLIDAAAEKLAFIIRAPKAGTLDKPEFLLGTVTQAPAAGLKISFQGVSLTTGDPDGVVGQFRTVTAGLTSNTWVAPGLVTSDGSDTGTKRVVTRGELLAIVIEYAAFGAGDSLNINTISSSGASDYVRHSYPDLFTAAWAKQANNSGILALKYDDGTYPFVGAYHAYSAMNSPAYGSGAGTNERSLYFKFPGKVKVGGAWVRIGGGATADSDIILYDSDGTTALATVFVDANVTATGSGQTLYAHFPSEITLLANTFYRLAVKPTTATAVTTYDFQVNAAAIMDAHEGGQSFYASDKVSGVWTETTTRRPFMGLLVTAVDDGGNLDQVVADLAQIKADLPTRITKNTAFPGRFPFFMASSVDHVSGLAGLAVTGEFSLDGGATWAFLAGSVVEGTRAGWYYQNGFLAAELNADAVAVRWGATGADTRNITIITQP